MPRNKSSGAGDTTRRVELYNVGGGLMPGKVKKVDFTRKGKWLSMLFLAFLFYFCVIMVNQQLSMRNLARRQAELSAEVNKYAAENELLKEQVGLIESDPEYLEGLARKELGLVRDGEIIYILPLE